MDRAELLKIAADPNINLNDLRGIQEQIAEKVLLQDDFDMPIAYVGGVDAAYIEDIAISACVILKWPNLELVTQKVVTRNIKFPYISTYFVFREGAAILSVLSEIEIKPTILLINSQGIMHPAFAGCASHIGVITNLPTIGVARIPLCGEWQTQPEEVGDWSVIRFRDRVVGAFLLTRKGRKPIVVSPGHRITLESSIDIVKNTLDESYYPKPLYLAHTLARAEQKRVQK